MPSITVFPPASVVTNVAGDQVFTGVMVAFLKSILYVYSGCSTVEAAVGFTFMPTRYVSVPPLDLLNSTYATGLSLST